MSEEKDECTPVESEISIIEILNDFYRHKNIPQKTGAEITKIMIIPDTDNRKRNQF